MNAELIYRPVSGEYPEQHFGGNTPDSLWVKFTDKDEGDWVGSFEQGWIERGTFIIPLEKHDKAFIVAGGQGFLVDVSTRQLIGRTAISDVKTFVVDHEQRNIYYSGGFDLRLMDTQGNDVVLFDKYHFDDVKLLKVDRNRLFAIYWNYQTSNDPFQFEIDLLTGEIMDSFDDAESKP